MAIYSALSSVTHPNEDLTSVPDRISVPQHQVLSILSKYLDASRIKTDHRHSQVVHASGRKAELDVWIEDMKIGIEYNGEHHYHKVTSIIMQKIGAFDSNRQYHHC